jgi:hypothetical protein
LAVLRKEIASGRINTSTHILHIVRDLSPDESWLRFSVFTGIDDDPVVYIPAGPDLGVFLREGRAKPMSELSRALGARPPYILAEVPTPKGVNISRDEYELLFERDNIKLYRRLDLARDGKIARHT